MTTGVPQERKEIAPAGYALGWGVDDYRGHRRVHHGGAIDGFVAATTLFPDDDLGHRRSGQHEWHGLPEMVTRHAADRLLGLPPIDWNGEALGKKAKNKAAAKEAKTKKDTRAAARERRPPTNWRNTPVSTSTPATASIKIELARRQAQFRLQQYRSPPRALALRGVQRPEEPQGPGLRGREGTVPDQRSRAMSTVSRSPSSPA